MRYGDDRAFILVEVLLEPVYALGIEVVGGLVEQQDVGLLQQQTAEGYAATLAAGQVCGQGIGSGQTQGGHGAFQTGVKVPGVGGVENVLQFALTGKKGIHLVLVLIIFGQTELLVYLFIFVEGIYHGLHAFTDNLDDGLAVVEGRILRQVAYGVAG